MKRGPATIEITIATMPAIRTSTIYAVTCRERLGDALEPHRPGALDEHAVAGAEQRLEERERLLDRVDVAAAVRDCLRADRDHLVDPSSAAAPPDLARGPRPM